MTKKTIQQQIDSYHKIQDTYFKQVLYRERLNKIISLLIRMGALDNVPSKVLWQLR
jgi:hypothetical protein